MATEQFVIGEGFKNRIKEQGLKPLSDESYFAPGLSICLTDKGPLYYVAKTNRVHGPFEEAPADQ